MAVVFGDLEKRSGQNTATQGIFGRSGVVAAWGAQGDQGSIRKGGPVHSASQGGDRARGSAITRALVGVATCGVRGGRAPWRTAVRGVCTAVAEPTFPPANQVAFAAIYWDALVGHEVCGPA